MTPTDLAPDTMQAIIEAVDKRLALANGGEREPGEFRPGYRMKAKGTTAEILIYDDIGESFFGSGISAKQFVRDLADLSKDVSTINVRINSFGGQVFDGFAIYNALKRHKARIEVDVDGIAASISSLIAMAGDQIRMAENSMLMMHEPMSIAFGNAADMRSEADLLDQIRDLLVNTYAGRSGMSVETVSDAVTAETWFTADEAVEAGLADRVTEAMKIAAHGDRSRFKRVPAAVKDMEAAVPVDPFWKARVGRQTAQLARSQAS